MNIPAFVKNPKQVSVQTLYEPKSTLFREYGLIAPGALMESDSSPFYIRVFNPTQQKVRIQANARVGTLLEVREVALAFNHAKMERQNEQGEGRGESEMTARKKGKEILGR